MKKILSLILFISGIACVKAADSDWKIHPIFDETVKHVVETPNYVYFTSQQLGENKSVEVFSSLFRYDKKGEELLPLSTSNILNGNSVRDIIYNPSKGYVGVLYRDYNLDLLLNNGTVVNIPFYAQAQMSYPKTVNSITADEKSDRLYLATDFGYVAINDKKNEIAESRLYGEPLKSFCRMGDLYVAVKGNEIVSAPVSAPRLSLNDYETNLEITDAERIYPLSDNTALLISGTPTHKFLQLLTIEGGRFNVKDLMDGTVLNIENNTKGLIVVSPNTIFQFAPDGNYTSLPRPENYRGSAAFTDNMADVWNGQARKGLSSVRKSGEKWSVTRDWMLPNSPSPFASTSYLNHPNYGFMVLSYGAVPSTVSLPNNNGFPYMLSSYKNGRWTNHSAAYTNPDRARMLLAPSGMTIDPDNSDYLYISSYHTGIARISLKDPQNVIQLMRKEGVQASKYPDTVELPDFPTTLSYYANISAPIADKQGNLWMAYANWDDQDNPNPHLYVWLAEDRRASSPTNIRNVKHVEVDTYMGINNYMNVLPLKKTGKCLLLIHSWDKDNPLVLVETNNTPTDTSDDKIYKFKDFYDSDGNPIDIVNIRSVYEDPNTGYVWICHTEGLCYFVPSQVLNGNYTFYKPKVARNDGTNLADYLLDGVMVNQVVQDSEGRKWFATLGAGVVCTSYDGREIVEEFTKSNSPLPSDNVYGIGYNTSNNSVFISTDDGFVEYLIPGARSASEKADVRAYPNPVRPEYSGFVTITDIPEGSFVKIADVAGNLVKDLGVMSGFEILWDLSDANFNRVRSGVYRIMVSPSGEGSSYSAVGKILVVS